MKIQPKVYWQSENVETRMIVLELPQWSWSHHAWKFRHYSFPVNRFVDLLHESDKSGLMSNVSFLNEKIDKETNFPRRWKNKKKKKKKKEKNVIHGGFGDLFPTQSSGLFNIFSVYRES